MSRSAQNLKGLFTPRPPRYPPTLPPQPQFEALATASSFLLRKATASVFSFFRRLFSKTLRFFSSSMDSFSFSLSSSPHSFNLDDDGCTIDSFPPSPSVEPLYLVPLSWWNDVNAAAMNGGKIGGVLYIVKSSVSKKTVEKDELFWEVESEIVLEMRRAAETETRISEVDGLSGSGDLRSLALLSEWMFLKAFKW